MKTDKPVLDHARTFARSIGPIAVAVGMAVSIQGLFLLSSPIRQFQPLLYGVVMIILGTAAYARTETIQGRIAQWSVTGVFVAGGIWSLMQWAPLLWGRHNASAGNDLMLVALWLTAGPALLVPGALIAVRPGWTPLIVVPALISLAFAATIGFGALYLIGVPDNIPLSVIEQAQLVGVSAFSAIFLIITGYHAIVAWRS